MYLSTILFFMLHHCLLHSMLSWKCLRVCSVRGSALIGSVICRKTEVFDGMRDWRERKLPPVLSPPKADQWHRALQSSA